MLTAGWSVADLWRCCCYFIEHVLYVLLCIHKGMHLMGINGISQKETRLILFVCLRLAQYFQRFFFFISASLMSLTTSFWVTAKHLPALKSGTWMHYLQCKRLACSRQDFIPGGTEDITESCIFVEMIKLQLQPQLQKLTLRRQMSSWKHEGKKYSTRKLCPAQKNICLAEG